MSALAHVGAVDGPPRAAMSSTAPSAHTLHRFVPHSPALPGYARSGWWAGVPQRRRAAR